MEIAVWLTAYTAYTMNVLCTVTNQRNEINDNDKNQSELICARFKPTEKKKKKVKTKQNKGNICEAARVRTLHSLIYNFFSLFVRVCLVFDFGIVNLVVVVHIVFVRRLCR